MAELSSSLADNAKVDSRTNTLVVGLDPEANADAVVDEIEGGVTGALDIGIAASLCFDDDACASAASAATAGLARDGLVVVVAPEDEATTLTCAYPGMWSHCVLPPVDACVRRAGRLPIGVVVVDLVTALPRLDRAMLVRASLQTPETTDAYLNAAIGAFTDAAGIVATQEGLAVHDRFARAFGSFVVVADPNARPAHLGAFRAVWHDAPAQAFLVGHDIQARDCTFAFNAATTVRCENAGAVLEAHVDPGSFELLDVTTTEPP